nr:zinc finger BED domain-containing protein RICESLEEPER 1-like [Ipomoea batatas]
MTNKVKDAVYELFNAYKPSNDNVSSTSTPTSSSNIGECQARMKKRMQEKFVRHKLQSDYTFELSADEDAQFKNPTDDEDAHFNNRADEDARDKKVPAAFDLNELPPEEVDEQIHGGGEPPEVAAPVTTEGDEENSPLAGQYKYEIRCHCGFRCQKQHNAENKTAVMESLIGSATPGSVYIEPPTVAK